MHLLFISEYDSDNLVIKAFEADSKTNDKTKF
jgi:hypothetical protein